MEGLIHVKGDWETRKVWVDGKELSPRYSQKVYNHSPDGFNWGYGGSGPAQFALAVCLEYLPREIALNCYQDYKWKWIATLPQDNFETDLPIPTYVKL